MKNKTRPLETLHSGVLVLLIFAFSFLLYANTLRHDFVWDDRTLIVEGVGERDFDVDDVLFSHFWSESERHGGLYRPAISVSYFVDKRLFGLNPSGFHLTNVLVNALTCVLVFVFMWLLFANTLLALLTAIVFTSMPLHTESVAWVSGRTDVLCSMWLLAALVLYLLARMRRVYWLVPLSLVAFVLAMMSKEIAVVLPIVIAYIEWTRFREGKGSNGVFVGLYAVVVLAFVLFRWRVVGLGVQTYEPFATGAVGTTALALSIFGGYVGKLLFPFRLNAEYDAGIPASVIDTSVALGLLMLAAGVFAGYRCRKHHPVVLGLIVFLAALLPVLNIVPITEVSAERFLYLPSLGFAMVVGFVFTRAMSARTRRQGIAVVLFAMLVTAYSLRTVVRNNDWKNEPTLFATTASASPGSARAHLNLGNTYLRSGDWTNARLEYEKALAIDAQYAKVWSGLAGAYKETGEFDKAVEAIGRAIAIEPVNADYYNSLGSLFARREQFVEAAEQFRKSLSLRPGDSAIGFNLGLAAYLAGDMNEAAELFLGLRDKDTKFAHAYYYLARIAFEKGRSADGRRHAEKFLSVYDADDVYSQDARSMLGR